MEPETKRRHWSVRCFLYWRENYKEAKERRETMSGFMSFFLGAALLLFRHYHLEKWLSTETGDKIAEIIEKTSFVLAAAWLLLWCPFKRHEKEHDEFKKLNAKKDEQIKTAVDARRDSARAVLRTFGSKLTQRMSAVAFNRNYDRSEDKDTDDVLGEIVGYVIMTFNNDGHKLYDQNCEDVYFGVLDGTRFERDRQRTTKLLEQRLKNLHQLYENIDKYMRQ